MFIKLNLYTVNMFEHVFIGVSPSISDSQLLEASYSKVDGWLNLWLQIPFASSRRYILTPVSFGITYHGNYGQIMAKRKDKYASCLLYTSDAADE